MRTSGIPFNPLRNALYTRQDLFAEFDPNDKDSYGRCTDVAIFCYFVKNGKNRVRDSRASTLEALHDNSISQSVRSLTSHFLRRVAIMGGHGLLRGTAGYNTAAHLARDLAVAGFLLVSGGGPGAMEATHLGAAHSAKPINELDESLKQLAEVPKLPKGAKHLVSSDGAMNKEIAREIHAWFAPAFAIAEKLGTDAIQSLGVPTWLYGFEPTSPFATHVAKYFQNSLREDGLITIGTDGIVYTEGTAGTVQEIFQDATQNYYGRFRPMVFLSSPAEHGQHYWERVLPVRALIEALLGNHRDFKKRVLFTDSNEAAVTFLKNQTDEG